jgi:hypothetical protein
MYTSVIGGIHNGTNVYMSVIVRNCRMCMLTLSILALDVGEAPSRASPNSTLVVPTLNPTAGMDATTTPSFSPVDALETVR